MKIKKYSLDNIYITNVIMCARQGENYMRIWKYIDLKIQNNSEEGVKK